MYRIAAKARDNTRSMGVAVAAGSIPETGALTFELGPDEIEIGMGAHGEPGISRQKLTTADAITEQMMAAILPDLPFRSGDEVALLINNLGATTMMELLVVNRCVRQDSRQGGDRGPSHRYRLVSDVSGDGRAVGHAAASSTTSLSDIWTCPPLRSLTRARETAARKSARSTWLSDSEAAPTAKRELLANMEESAMKALVLEKVRELRLRDMAAADASPGLTT